MPTAASDRRALRRLARACSVQTTYQSGLTGKTEATDDSLLLTLRSLGVDVASPEGADRALAGVLDARRARRVEPVIVCWNGRNATAMLRLATTKGGSPKATGRVRTTLTLEDGDTLEAGAPAADLPRTTRRDPDGTTAHFATVEIAPGWRLPEGYHTLSVEHAGETFESLVISAPRISYQDPGRRLGLFCPTYAIRSDANAGVGNLTDLARIGAWASVRGAPILGTLPLLACFMEDSPLFTMSPYSPVTRLFFNEVYLDPAMQPELEGSPRAKKLLGSAKFARAAAGLRAERSLVDYRRSYDLLRPVLDELAETFFASGKASEYPFGAFLRDNPRAERYAAFRAVCERRGEAWTEWPGRLRTGTIRKSDADPRAYATHLWSQFAMTQSLNELNTSLGTRGGGLYLDLAVGAHPDGFDTWDEQGLFVTGASVGSPPDSVHTNGQDWGFPPMHPERARERGYSYFIDSLRAQMRIANVLRLDHVMAMHRLYTVPEGRPANEGVYVQYPEEELFAILSLESHRNKCRLFGENLGTVPAEIERAMTRHRVGKMHVGQFALRDDPKRAANPVAANCVASLNTHDVAPFAGHLAGSDIPERVKLGVFAKSMAADERAGRERVRKPVIAFLRAHGMLAKSGTPSAPELAMGIMRYLASSEAELVLVNIEDLWGETKMQNVPGTSTEHPNWRRKLRKTLRAIQRDDELAGAVEVLVERRKKRAMAVTKVKSKKK
ncbi:MAG: 4-alpha-glucanotransferase [Phycisphaeraceae bacterium]|nr:MAG: 4-alpha-glucanotransferase [Phycisphaeraceae bacterium]